MEHLLRFLLFIENMGHKSEKLANTVLEISSQIIHNILISDCRDQCYDNARNMPGLILDFRQDLEKLTYLLSMFYVLAIH